MGIGFSAVMVIFFALNFLAVNQCKLEDQAMKMRREHTSRGYIHFESASGAVKVDIHTLEKLKLAMLSFFNKPDTEFPAQYLDVRNTFREELKSSAVWISEDSAGVGVWKLESQAGHLALVRYPPPSKSTMYIFHATLEHNNSGWEVISFEHEREFGPD
jgi:hypothetical protein